MKLTKPIMNEKLIQNTKFSLMHLNRPQQGWKTTELYEFIDSMDRFGFFASDIDVHEFHLDRAFFLNGLFTVRFNQANYVYCRNYIYSFRTRQIDEDQ